MSKRYEIEVRYPITVSHVVRADTVDEAEKIVLEGIQSGELTDGSVVADDMENAEVVKSGEVEHD